MASWVVVASAKDAPAVFNLWLSLVCSVNEYASWKVLLVLVYPHYTGLFILLDCGWSGNHSPRPMSRHRLVTSPLVRVHSLLTIWQLSACWRSAWKPHWHHNRKWSLELVQVCINILKIQKLKLLMNRLNGEWVVMLLNIDSFISTFVVVSHNSSRGCACWCMHVRVCFIRSSSVASTRPLRAGLTSSGSHYLHTCSCLKVDLPG